MDSEVDEILVLSGEIHPKSSRRESWLRRILDICELSLAMGFLPHTNVGPLSESEMRALAAVNVSMGLMVEQTTPSLMAGVHRFAPNKTPRIRLEQLRQAGQLKIAFTTGVLLGVGETRKERIQSIRDIAEIANKYGNIQEVILQPYSPGTREKLNKERVMKESSTVVEAEKEINLNEGNRVEGISQASDHATPLPHMPDTEFLLCDLPAFVEEARHILPADVAIQVPPNLVLRGRGAVSNQMSSGGSSEGIFGADSSNSQRSSTNAIYNSNEGSSSNNSLLSCLTAGASDLGGISPFDEVNPDWPFPPLPALRQQLSLAGYQLERRLPIHERLIATANLSVKIKYLLKERGAM
jgi:FO synthase subunit 1